MKVIFAIMIILGVSTFALAQKNSLNEFVNKAGSGSMKEAKLGQIAAQRANSAEVKEYGRTLHKDHSKAADELRKIAKSDNLDFPSSLSAKDQEKVEEFQGIEKSSFDKKFVEDMIKDHEKDIREFEDAAKNNDNEDVREWAKKTVPTLRDHLKIAQSLSGKI